MILNKLSLSKFNERKMFDILIKLKQEYLFFSVTITNL